MLRGSILAGNQPASLPGDGSTSGRGRVDYLKMFRESGQPVPRGFEVEVQGHLFASSRRTQVRFYLRGFGGMRRRPAASGGGGLRGPDSEGEPRLCIREGFL